MGPVDKRSFDLQLLGPLVRVEPLTDQYADVRSVGHYGGDHGGRVIPHLCGEIEGVHQALHVMGIHGYGVVAANAVGGMAGDTALGNKNLLAPGRPCLSGPV